MVDLIVLNREDVEKLLDGQILLNDGDNINKAIMLTETYEEFTNKIQFMKSGTSEGD